MLENELATIAALEGAGDHRGAHVHAVELASGHRNDVRAQLAAAYACDRLGLEQEAVAYYELAWQLGVPQDERPDFLLGFGSTLRNVGRAKEAVTLLTEATVDYPENLALLAFLALALHSAGRADLALATMLDAALRAARPGGFGPYSRALTQYQAGLAAEAQRPTPE